MEANSPEDQILVGRNNSVFHYSLPALCMIIIAMVVGLVCNIMMIVTYQSKLKRNSTYFFIFCLATFDLINCLILPFQIYDLRNPYMYSASTLCKVHKFFSFATELASGNTIVAISFDRYFRFARPHTKFSLKKAKGIVVITVVVSLFLCLFALYIYGEEEVAVDTQASIIGTRCGIHKEAKATIAPHIFTVILLVSFTGGVIVITTVYALLWIRFKQWNRKRQERTTGKQSNSHTGQNNDTLQECQTFPGTEQLHDEYQIYQSNLGLEQIDVTLQKKEIYPNNKQKNNTNQDNQTYQDIEQTDDVHSEPQIGSGAEQKDVSNPLTKTYPDAELNEEQQQKQETNEEYKNGLCTTSLRTGNTIRQNFDTDTSGNTIRPNFDTDTSGNTIRPNFDTDTSGNTIRPNFDTDTTGNTIRPNFDTDTTGNTIRPNFDTDTMRASTLPLNKRKSFGHNVSPLSGSIRQDETRLSNKSFSQMNNSKKGVRSTLALNRLKIRDLIAEVHKNNVSRSMSLGHLGKIRRVSNIKMMSTFRKSSIATIASRSLKMNRTTIMFLAATVSFVICRVPYIIIAVLRSLQPEAFTYMDSFEIAVYTIFLHFFVLSYAINPLIYSFLNPKIRSEYFGLLYSLSNLVFRGRRNNYNVSSIAQDSSTVVRKDS